MSVPSLAGVINAAVVVVPAVYATNGLGYALLVIGRFPILVCIYSFLALLNSFGLNSLA